MYKVTIEGFETEEQMVCFVDWFRRRCDDIHCKLLTTEGCKDVQWDGIDTNNEDKSLTIVDVLIDDFESVEFN